MMADSKSLEGARPVASISGRCRRAICPVIVGCDKRSVSSVQFQDRVGERIGHAEADERRSDRAQENSLRFTRCDDDSSDGNLIAGFHVQPGRDVQRLGGNGRVRCRGR